VRPCPGHVAQGQIDQRKSEGIGVRGARLTAAVLGPQGSVRFARGKANRGEGERCVSVALDSGALFCEIKGGRPHQCRCWGLSAD
jgi:hypothetical protein